MNTVSKWVRFEVKETEEAWWLVKEFIFSVKLALNIKRWRLSLFLGRTLFYRIFGFLHFSLVAVVDGGNSTQIPYLLGFEVTIPVNDPSPAVTFRNIKLMLRFNSARISQLKWVSVPLKSIFISLLVDFVA